MNYYMLLKGNMNIRQTPNPNGVLIKMLPTNTRVEGDELFKDAANRDWLKVLLIDGVQTTQPTYIATYTTSGVLVTNPIPPEPLPFQVGLNIVADSAVRLVRIELDGSRSLVYEGLAGNYAMEFTANDSNAPFIRME